MKILFLSYWEIEDGLTSATIFPHLRILAESDKVASITFCSVERTSATLTPATLGIPKVTHVPLSDPTTNSNPIKRLFGFLNLSKQLSIFVSKHPVDKVICRSATAGALGFRLHQQTGVAFHVESFEPHGAYMLESGVWSRWDPRYLLQQHWEKKQKKYATSLQTVSNNYLKCLQQEGVPDEKLDVIPCATDLDAFGFSISSRERVRKKIGLSEERVVGVYLGKFGDIYYDEDAFAIFQQAFDQIGPDFFLLILTPHDAAFMNSRIKKFGIPANSIWFRKVPHTQVPEYLSAADFAFSLHKKTKWSFAFSPIKNGEYWANGLPIVLPKGVGDDDAIALEEEAGAVFDILVPNETTKAIDTILNLIAKPGHRNRIALVAKRHRSFTIARQVYTKRHLIEHSSDSTN